MRPVRLVMEGFGTYRERTEVSFEGADLFALVGATGSGKSTVIDAIVFALYGTVPRLDRKAVAPVVSAGRAEATVLFEFEVGEQRYTALRVVRRNRSKAGAKVTEARLETPEAVIAGQVREMDAAVVNLLGLGVEQFLTCVVLPQGEFARFLHSPPGDRQELLVKLLDLGLYRQLGQAARHRSAAARTQLEIVDAGLARLGDATPQRRDELAAAEAALDASRATIDALAPALDEAAAAVAAARAEHADATALAATLAALKRPAEHADLARRHDEVRDAAASAGAEVDAAAAALDAARAALDAATPPDRLDRWRESWADLDRLTAAVETGAARLADADAELAAATADHAAAVAAAEAAETARDAARLAHRAAHLATALVAGEPCPVCRQTVHDLPAAPDGAADLDAAEAAATGARATADAATARLTAAQRTHDQVAPLLDERRRQLDAAVAAVADIPPAAEIEALAAATAAARTALTAAEAAHAAVRSRSEAATAAVDALAQQLHEAWAQVEAARDAVAGAQPPALDRTSLAAAWDQLEAWATQHAPLRQAAVAQLAAGIEAAATRQRALADQVVAAATGAGVDATGPGDARDRVVDALATARAQLTMVEKQLGEVAELTARRADTEARRTVADLLGRLLKSDGFERWLLDEAFEVLLAGAGELLHALSGGQYSLALDEKREQFLVVDHHAADEPRLARTLSGGETFLVSLALALALGDQVALLSADGAPRLDSIFLDEGFGTLDPESLEVVAAAIEDLGARGRTVGLVTHVRDLAERVPVRFEVAKHHGSSTVTRVER